MHHIKEEKKPSFNGQSFIELALVLVILLILMTGAVEFGNLLNQYINVIDGAREGARQGANFSPFNPDYSDNPTFYISVDEQVEGQYNYDPYLHPNDKGAIAPVVLNPATDDVDISVFSVSSNNTIVRFPATLNGGAGYWSRYNKHASEVTTADVMSKLDPNAPDTGIIVVEVFYDYNQILKMPYFTAVVPDPVELHAVAFMPNSSAEPTATPEPP